MNRLCPTFLSVGVSYQPASLTFSRRNHHLPSSPRPSQHRGDVVGVADSISTHVVDKSLGLHDHAKIHFHGRVASVPRWENKVVSLHRCQTTTTHTHIRAHMHRITPGYRLFLAFGDRRSPINRSLPHSTSRCSLSVTWPPR